MLTDRFIDSVSNKSDFFFCSMSKPFARFYKTDNLFPIYAKETAGRRRAKWLNSMITASSVLAAMVSLICESDKCRYFLLFSFLFSPQHLKCLLFRCFKVKVIVWQALCGPKHHTFPSIFHHVCLWHFYPLKMNHFYSEKLVRMSKPPFNH